MYESEEVLPEGFIVRIISVFFLLFLASSAFSDAFSDFIVKRISEQKEIVEHLELVGEKVGELAALEQRLPPNKRNSNAMIRLVLEVEAERSALVKRVDDIQQEIKYWEMAHQGNANAQYLVGFWYDEGEKVKKDNEEALNWIRKAARQGHKKAQDIIPDFERKLELQRDKARKYVHTCKQLYEMKNYFKAKNWCRKASASNDAQVLYILGTMKHAAESREQARDWLLKAAAQGHVEAQYHLGYLYDYYDYHGGSDVERKQQALQWYQKAAALGHARSAFRIGYFYQMGRGVEKDIKQAVKFYQKAAELGDPKALARLGRMYAQGDGVTQNYQKALDLYRREEARGSALAGRLAARLCEKRSLSGC